MDQYLETPYQLLQDQKNNLKIVTQIYVRFHALLKGNPQLLSWNKNDLMLKSRIRIFLKTADYCFKEASFWKSNVCVCGGGGHEYPQNLRTIGSTGWPNADQNQLFCLVRIPERLVFLYMYIFFILAVLIFIFDSSYLKDGIGYLHIVAYFLFKNKQ